MGVRIGVVARARHDQIVVALSLLAILSVVCSGGVALMRAVSDSHGLEEGSDEPQHVLVSACAYAQGAIPVASAGPDQTVTVDSTVELSGSGSEPSDGATIVNYTWNVRPPVQSYQAAFVMYGETVSFLANETGLYTVNLTVEDTNNLTAWDTVYVIVEKTPKTFLESYWLHLLVGLTVGGYLVYLALGAALRVLRGSPVLSTSSKEKLKRSLNKLRETNRSLLRNRMGLIGAVLLTVFLLMAILGPTIAPYDIKAMDLTNKFQKPSKDHWLGTDQVGADIFSQLLVGAQASIIIGVFSAIIASFLGAAIGLYSGYVGGRMDELIMRLNDVVLSIPWLVLMIVIAALMGEITLLGIILIIALTGWSMTARMVRAQVMTIKERQFIERAKAIGAGDFWIIRRYVFPNTFPLIFANTILTVAVSILSEATLSFLRLRPADAVTWGKMLSFASESSAMQIGLEGWILVPGICIVLLVLAFTLLGYALDEILNPKLRHR